MNRLRGLIVLGLAFVLCFLLIGNVYADQILHKSSSCCHKVKIEWRDKKPPQIEFIMEIAGRPPRDELIFKKGQYEVRFKDLPELSKGTWFVWIDLEEDLRWIMIKRNN